MANLIGKQIDQYLIQKLIARGGMAEVYLAMDVTLRRQVALKVMLSELAIDQTATARFRREAEAVARLNHPNIIQIYTTGITPDNRSYLAMQYVSGGTLQQRLAELSRNGQQMSVGDSLYLARQMAAALQVAHQQEIVHRDLKPSNILLHTDGEPVLTDLGIAAMDTAATRLTQSGSVMGTPHYMSPEQALGRNVDGRSDIYSLGIILYELLAGHVPFAADSPLAVLHQHIYEPPRSLTKVRSGLSRSTYQTVDTCLQKEPEKRFQTAEQLTAALDHSLMSEGLKTPQVVTAYPTVKIPDQRRRWPIWAVAALVILFAAIGVGYLVAGPGGPDPPKVTEEAQDQIPAVVIVTATQLEEATSANIPTETAGPTELPLFDPGCSPDQEDSVYVGENGDLCFGGTIILNLDAETGGCSKVSEIPPSPTNDHFVAVLQCPQGENEAFVFRADGTDKRRLTAESDYVNEDKYLWTADGYFVYQRTDLPPLDDPHESVVWYDPETGQKRTFDSSSPLEQYGVTGVASDDLLYIRANAGADNPDVGSIPYDGSGIVVTGLGVRVDGDQWVPVRYQDLTGWVNSYFIVAQGDDPPPATPQATADVTASFLASSPTIDGSLADWPPGPTFLSAFIVHPVDSQDVVDDVEAVWRLGWDDNYLYVAVTVEDDVHVQTKSDLKIWQGDSVEIQFDTDPAGGSGQEVNGDDFQLNASPGDFEEISWFHYLSQGVDGTQFDNGIYQSIVIAAQRQGEAGYTMEMAIPWQDLRLSPEAGRSIGIALNVSDNDLPGTTNQEVLKSSSQSREYTVPDSWGTLTLQE